MTAAYIDFINQSFDLPKPEFKLEKKALRFHDIDLMHLAEDYGTPLKFTYLPQISNNIKRSKQWFSQASKNITTKATTAIAIAKRVHILSIFWTKCSQMMCILKPLRR